MATSSLRSAPVKARPPVDEAAEADVVTAAADPLPLVVGRPVLGAVQLG
jgi:hypothetical protein